MTTWISDLPRPETAALFLDFDGTLVDLAPTPDAVTVPSELPRLLSRLLDATAGALALVSGRSVATLSGLLPGYSGTIVGGHGAEWRLDGCVNRHDLAGSESLATALQEMSDFAAARPGVLFEPKPTGGVLHYRRLPELGPDTAGFMQALARRTPGMGHHGAKMAEELRPNDIGKDRAVAELMRQPPFAGRCGVFFGDDTTDEPAMAWLMSQGGHAVKLGPGASCAPIRLDSPASLREGLETWLR